jgi:hypothetical protein
LGGGGFFFKALSLLVSIKTSTSSWIWLSICASYMTRACSTIFAFNIIRIWTSTYRNHSPMRNKGMARTFERQVRTKVALMWLLTFIISKDKTFTCID